MANDAEHWYIFSKWYFFFAELCSSQLSLIYLLDDFVLWCFNYSFSSLYILDINPLSDV